MSARRLLMRYKKSRRKRYAACDDVAETVGFEPTDRLITSQTISSRSRYDHFDTSPYMQFSHL